MKPLITVHKLSKSYGLQRLFQNLSFTLHEGEKVALIGPNGAGKSTLLKIMMGLEEHDEGSIAKTSSLVLGYSEQSPEFPPLSVEEILTRGEEKLEIRARILLQKGGFENGKQMASTLSGGWKKRLDILAALMLEPELILLDEPTNHLDIEGILWLENLLKREKIATLIVSHDRTFLERVTHKTMELNKCYPEGLFISDGALSQFLERKEAFLAGQLEQERALASHLRGEIDWLRRSPQARTTKSSARVQKAHELIGEHKSIRQRNKKIEVDLAFSSSERETRKLLVAKNLGKSFGENVLFKNVDITLSPGTRLGIVGKNGTGKTTLLKMLAGMIAQDQGTIKLADDLKLVYFDQHREEIPPYITLREALSPSGDTVDMCGTPMHVVGLAKRFCFSPDSLKLPVSALSGGERARILIARLMCKKADILFLDEPTNDLDITTLEVIEESLKEFKGAVVLISHDRSLMERVCTQIVGLGEGKQLLFADYAQWENSITSESNKKEKGIDTREKSKKKLSYLEQKELEGMEGKITKLEEEIATLTAHLTPASTKEEYAEVGKKQRELETFYERWQLLLDKL